MAHPPFSVIGTGAGEPSSSMFLQVDEDRRVTRSMTAKMTFPSSSSGTMLTYTEEDLVQDEGNLARIASKVSPVVHECDNDENDAP